VISPQVAGDQTGLRRDGHAWVRQSGHEGPHHVTAGETSWLEDHDDLPAGPPQARLQGVAGAERLDRVHGLGDRRGQGRAARSHDDDLGRARHVGRQGTQAVVDRVRPIGDDDHGRRRGGQLCQPRGHALDGAVVAAPIRLEVGGLCGCELEIHARVDDAPAGRLDARPQHIGRPVVTPSASRCALVRQGHDLGRC
jgi:hypothetical protein